MDQETKQYIDAKFAEQARQHAQQAKTGQAFIAKKQKLVKTIIFASTAVLLVLAGLEFYLLYSAQFAHK